MPCQQGIQRTDGPFQVQHITRSPHFPQSNGFADAMVKIAKKLMDHSTLQEKPWNFGLM